MEDIDLQGIVHGKVTIPIDTKHLSQYEKRISKVESIILESMKDHTIPCITRISTNENFDSLKTMYEVVNILRNILLKNKLTQTCMSNLDIVVSYLMKITKVIDQFFIIGIFTSPRCSCPNLAIVHMLRE
jgi:hypothetical protein